MKPEDIAAICRDSTVLLNSAHPGIDFSCRVPDETMEVFCDRRQIGQALTNLMQNAVDAIEARAAQGEEAQIKGKVDIAVERQPGRIAVVVSDNGIGLPRKERDRLTEPYVTTREKGTGLGLAIVRKIMEDHGGSVVLEDRDGGGAKVSLIFPAELTVEAEAEDVAATEGRKGVVAHGV